MAENKRKKKATDNGNETDTSEEGDFDDAIMSGDESSNETLAELSDKEDHNRDHDKAEIGKTVKYNNEKQKEKVETAQKNERSYTNYKYDEEHKGPYLVYLDVLNDEGERRPINAIRVSNVLIDLKVNNIIEVIKIGRSRCKIIFSNAVAANRFVDNIALKEKGYIPKIFAHMVHKIGIIFNIPRDITEEELASRISSPIEIVKIQRVYKTDKGDKFPTERVKLTFKGLEIPKKIVYAFTEIKVKYFIPFGQCYKCYRFNHFAMNCKDEKTRCRECFQEHGPQEQCLQLKCTNCGLQHIPTDKNCPAREKAYIIKKTMTVENISINEARARFNSIFGNRFEMLENYNGEFPEIKNGKKAGNEVRNNSQEAAKTLHKTLSYAKVVKINKTNEVRNAKETMKEWRRTIENMDENVNPGQYINQHQTSEIQKTLNQLTLNLAGFLTNSNKQNISNETFKYVQSIKQTIEKLNNEIDLQKIRNIQHEDSSI